MKTKTRFTKIAPIFQLGKKAGKKTFAFAFLAVVCAVVLTWQTDKTSAAREKGSLSGTLTVAWVDALPGSEVQSRVDFALVDSQGETHRLIIDQKTIDDAGGLMALAGKRVDVKGSADASARLSPAFAVSSIALSTAPSPDVLTPRLGNLKYANILCKFTDNNSTPFAPGWYTGMLGPNYPQQGHFWRELSYDQMNIDGSTTHGWYQLPYTQNHYWTQGYFDYQAFSEDCGALADGDVYFPDYYGVNFAANVNFEGVGGRGSSLLSLSFDSVQKFYGATWTSIGGWASQKIVAHEMGHSLGLPHSNGGNGNEYDSLWDVMSSPTSSVVDPVYGPVGPHTVSAYKDFLGWIPSNRLFTAPISGATTINLAKLNTTPLGGNKYLMAKIPIGGSFGSYYTVELRRLEGYDAPVPAKAVVIHKVHSGGAFVVDGDGDLDVNDDGAQWQPGETFYSAADRVSVTVNYETAGMYNVTVEANAGCTFSLSPPNASFKAGGGNDSFDMVTQSGCYWTLSGADTVTEVFGEGFDVADAPFGPPYVGLASVYPSTAAVSGVSGSVSKITVTLNRINHSTPGDLDIILVAPNGEKVMLMSDAGASDDMNAELIFDQYAEKYLDEYGGNSTGTYRPTDYGFTDIFPSPGPGTAIFNTDLDAFNGISPNGNWKLYAVDDANSDSGTLTRGWYVNISTGAVTTSTFWGIGPTTINYTVTRNYSSSPRTIYLTVGGQTFTISQLGA